MFDEYIYCTVVFACVLVNIEGFAILINNRTPHLHMNVRGCGMVHALIRQKGHCGLYLIRVNIRRPPVDDSVESGNASLLISVYSLKRLSKKGCGSF